jgi:hypothetical protein
MYILFFENYFFHSGSQLQAIKDVKCYLFCVLKVFLDYFNILMLKIICF